MGVCSLNMAAMMRAASTNLAGHGRRTFKSGLDSRVTAVLGGQWGDEGKGKLADVLAKNYDIVGRFNGGANAGHTVVANGKKYAFHLLPCGLIYEHTMNILGNGVVVDLDAMFEELEPLDADGLEWRGRLKISDRAPLLFPFHKQIDQFMEDARGDKSIGTTKKGIGPCYATKAFRTGLRVGQLRDWDTFETNLRETATGLESLYGFDVGVEPLVDQYKMYADKLINEHDMIIDGVHYVNDAYNNGKNIITEGANAAMLDMDFGTYPFVTSSSTTIGGICSGLGLSPDKIECAMGVIKAYTTRVGWGPFPTELTDSSCGGEFPDGAPGSEIGRHLQEVGHEIGVTTGRKRRCGWLDIPVIQYGHMINNYASINLTKLDVLDDLDEIKLGVSYSINGQLLKPGQMPSTIEDLAKVEVNYESMPGWNKNISAARTFEELPVEAQNYVNRIEELSGTKVSWIGVGVGREDMCVKGFTPEFVGR